MLEVQKYLKSGKTLQDLSAELGIIASAHDTLPLVILNYGQIDSPKTNPIARECRGLVLNSQTFDLVARSFPRFFNWGEVADEMPLFNFNTFNAFEKVDGSLVILYNFEGKWMANTRGSFGTGAIDRFSNRTWHDGFCAAMGVDNLEVLAKVGLDPKLTYVCEFCSPWNKIVRRYPEPLMYLLSRFEGETEIQWNENAYRDICTTGLFEKVKHWHFSNVDQILVFLEKNSTDDPTFEGVVIRDDNNRRWKIKSKTYLGLHAIKGAEGNLFNPKHLLPFVLSGNGAELLTYFEEATDAFNELKKSVDREFEQLTQVWHDYKDVADQKTFALAINGKTRFTSILFTIKKKFGNAQTLEHLQHAWRNSEAQILNNLKLE
jgi:hypothetical protein